MKQAFIEKNFKTATLLVIAQANEIIDEYQEQGYKLTLRQLYYQFVARDLIENSYKSYKRLGGIIGDARLTGYIDWSAIEDRTRSLWYVSHWVNPESIIDSAAYSFRLDKWKDQPNRIEVWIEKEALSGVIQPVCRELDVAYFSNRGYMSLSEMHNAGKRFAKYIKAGQEVHILHLGDHDPSGIDMTRDIQERTSMFAAKFLDVDRLALNFDQIDVYNPPPNFAKQTDSRYKEYALDFGTDSWELDALEPAVLSELIENAVIELRDEKKWLAKVAKESVMRDLLSSTSKHWKDVKRFLKHIKDDEEE